MAKGGKLYVLELQIVIEQADDGGEVTLQLPESTDWPLDLKQPHSNEMRKGVIISPEHEEERTNTGSKDTVNFAMKWPGEKKQSYLTVMSELNPHVINSDNCGENMYTPIIGFNCNGLQPVNWNVTADTLPFTLQYDKGDDGGDVEDEWEEGGQGYMFECQVFVGEATEPTTVRIIDWRFTDGVDGKKKKKQNKGKNKKNKK